MRVFTVLFLIFLRCSLVSSFLKFDAKLKQFISRPTKFGSNIMSSYMIQDISTLQLKPATNFDALWSKIQHEAEDRTYGDRKSSIFMTNAVLSETNLDDVIINHVANQLESIYFQSTQMRNLFSTIRDEQANISSLWALDLIACAKRDKLLNTVNTLLFSKGYHALVTHRIACALWYGGRRNLACYLQSLASRVFGADIHPACRIGQGCYLSTATGVVIGETCVIGDDCGIAHAITLGGTGKEKGDRHPKLGNGVYLASSAIVLGNIPIGDGSVISPGSVVTKPVAAYTKMSGVPAKVVGVVAKVKD